MLGLVSAALGVSLGATLLAQAEAAPPEPEAPAPVAAAAAATAPLPPPNALAIHGRLAYRPGEATGPPSASGFSLGATFEHRYAAPTDRLGLGLGVDLFFDRFAGAEGPRIPTSDLLTRTSFVLLQTAEVRFALAGSARPSRAWVGAGGGGSVGYYSSAGLADATLDGSSATATEVQALARGAAGFDVAFTHDMDLVVRADFTHPLTQPTIQVGPPGARFASSPFGDIFDFGLGLLYRF